MIIHIPTGAKFQNRKAAKELIGLQKYKKLAKKGEFIYLPDDSKNEMESI